jgi:FAD:protein FMN transferase
VNTVRPEPASVTFRVFGTTAVLLVTDPRALAAARAIADAELAAVDMASSRFRPDSELSRVNNSGGELCAISELFATLIAAALRAAELSGGAVDPTCGQAVDDAGYDRDFDEIRAGDRGPAHPDAAGMPTAAPGGPGRNAVPGRPRRNAIPGWPRRNARPGWRSVQLDAEHRAVRLFSGARLDLGSTAKAWAADRCAGLVAAKLGCGVLVSLGGDIAVAGEPPPQGWLVRVTDDHAAADDAPGQTVAIRSGGLATSSTTVRAWTSDGKPMHHIIDPATGAPVHSCWRTVSVAAASCTDANIGSTAAIVKAEAAISWLTDSGLPARLVGQDGTVATTAGWPAQ